MKVFGKSLWVEEKKAVKEFWIGTCFESKDAYYYQESCFVVLL